MSSIKKCKICGSPVKFEASTICFSCGFWQTHLESDATLPPHTACMIDGTHYVIGEEDSKSYFRGFGGAHFAIQFKDGTLVHTTNLWCQGEPSKEWIDKFPDNAKFLSNLKWKKIGSTYHLVKE